MRGGCVSYEAVPLQGKHQVGGILGKASSAVNSVVSLDSVYGGKCSFDAHLAHCGVEHGIPQRVSPRGKGTFSARYGRASFEVRAEKSNYTIARRPFAEGNSLRGTGQNVEGALDQVGPYVA